MPFPPNSPTRCFLSLPTISSLTLNFISSRDVLELLALQYLDHCLLTTACAIDTRASPSSFLGFHFFRCDCKSVCGVIWPRPKELMMERLWIDRCTATS